MAAAEVNFEGNLFHDPVAPGDRHCVAQSPSLSPEANFGRGTRLVRLISP